jgi:hypothetical protein
MVAEAAGPLLIYVIPVVPRIMQTTAVFAENVLDFHRIFFITIY